MSTFMANSATVNPQWFVIDATDQVVGRLAVVIANILRGKTAGQDYKNYILSLMLYKQRTVLHAAAETER